MRWGALLPILSVIVLPGCPHEEMDLEMSLDGDGFLRTWSVRATGDQGPGARRIERTELERASAAYGKAEVAADGRTARFEGRFRGTTPPDVGGSGRVAVHRTSLGSAVEYVEEFRGTDDPAGELAHRLAGAEAIAGHLVAWARREFRRDPELPRLRAFLDREVRRDLRNLALALFEVGDPGGPDSPTESERLRTGHLEAWMRGLLYATSRGWVTWDELDRLQGGGDLFARPAGGVAMIETLVRRVAVDRAGLKPEGLGGRVAALAGDAERLEASLMRYVESTREGRSACRGKVRDRDCRSDLVWRTVAPALGGEAEAAGGREDTVLRVSFGAATAPWQTNGQWDAAAGRVRWSTRVPAEAASYRRLPVLLFARWATPDRAAQERAFGKVALEGEALARYCAWRAHLSAGAADAWESWVGGLSGGTEAARAEVASRAVGKTAAQGGVARELQFGYALLREALEPATP